jgi:methanogenic corrinoid protein MtbC1
MSDRLELLRGIAEDPGELDSDIIAPQAAANTGPRSARTPTLSEPVVATLLDKVLVADTDDRGTLASILRDMKIGLDDVVDIYVPEAARRLGEDWHCNRRSFADVTIGTARLQGLLREIVALRGDDYMRDASAPGIAVIVLENEFHTLGAMVLSQQLRRQGISVQMIIGQSEPEILQSVSQHEFDAILVSVSRSECLASLGKLVEKLRNAISRPTPVVVGGAAIGDESEIRILTGADHVARDAKEALTKCGLKTSHHGAGLRASSA